MSFVTKGAKFQPGKFTSGLDPTTWKNLELLHTTLCFSYTISMWKYLGFL